MRKVVIASPIETQSGYGQHAREFVSQIFKHKESEWDIKLLSMPWGHTPFTVKISDVWRNNLLPLPLQAQPDIWVQITVPNEFQPVGKFNIGVSAVTEGNICKPEWIDAINRFDIIIVPSIFSKSVFEETAKKANKPIKTTIIVIPEYLELEYEADNRKSGIKIEGIDDIPEKFAFINVGHWLPGQLNHDRKDVSGLINTFFDTYKNTKNPPALILKTSGATYSITDAATIQDKIRQIAELHTGNLPNVYLLHGELSNDEMVALYEHPKVKAMVTFTKGEGFGRPLLEFSTTGKPILAPYYSGQTDFLKKDFICSLPGGQTPIHKSAQSEFLIQGATWYSVDYRFASKMMKEVQKNYKKWSELAKRQRFFAINNFNNKAVSEKYKTLFDVISEQTKDMPMQQALVLPKLTPTVRSTPVQAPAEKPALQLPKLKVVK